ncbi:hypothetical protein DFP72DRAFT_878843 [Ephemerocybe angulata]|uniref:Uncharacterized protein n=1 Tax=Ephemerocybe angulata TaxID=980116 RepID=A0A8H6MAT6_9AGAR|nr:hypothetical protein DFP72DRAFT_878843 [Tulosesus angulatus]
MLPYELVEQVVLACAKEDIARISLAAKVFVDPAQTRLYERVRVAGPDECSQLLSLLQTSPHLAQKIKSFAYEGLCTDPPLQGIFLLLTKLKELELKERGVGVGRVSQATPDLESLLRLPTLEKLKLVRWRFQDEKGFTDLLANASPHCKHLTLDSPRIRNWGWPNQSSIDTTKVERLLSPTHLTIIDRENSDVILVPSRKFALLDLSCLRSLHLRTEQESHAGLSKVIQTLDASIQSLQLSPMNITDRCVPPVSFEGNSTLKYLTIDHSHTWFGFRHDHRTRAHASFEECTPMGYAGLVLATFNPAVNILEHLSLCSKRPPSDDLDSYEEQAFLSELARLIAVVAKTFPRLHRLEYSLIGLPSRSVKRLRKIVRRLWMDCRKGESCIVVSVANDPVYEYTEEADSDKREYSIFLWE